MAIPVGVWIDALDRGVAISFEPGDCFGTVGIIACCQNNALLRQELNFVFGRLVFVRQRLVLTRTSNGNTDDRSVFIFQEPLHWRVHSDSPAELDQPSVQRCDVSFCYGHDVVHSRDAVGRFRIWAVKRQAHVHEPVNRVRSVGKKIASQFIVVASFDVCSRELSSVYMVIRWRIVNAGSRLKPRLTGSERANGDSGSTTKGRLLFEKQDTCSVFRRTDGCCASTATSPDNDDVVAIFHVSMLAEAALRGSMWKIGLALRDHPDWSGGSFLCRLRRYRNPTLNTAVTSSVDGSGTGGPTRIALSNEKESTAKTAVPVIVNDVNGVSLKKPTKPFSSSPVPGGSPRRSSMFTVSPLTLIVSMFPSSDVKAPVSAPQSPQKPKSSSSNRNSIEVVTRPGSEAPAPLPLSN